jgi:hypothetical protein
MKPCAHRKILANPAAIALAPTAASWPVGEFLCLCALFFPALAFGQWTRDQLNANAATGGTVTLPAAGVGFAHDALAVEITADALLRGEGWMYNPLPSRVGDLSADILGAFAAQKSGTTALLVPLVQNRVNAFAVPSGMAFVQGDGTARTNSSANLTDFDKSKWLKINAGKTLGLESLHFREVTANYTFSATSAGGVVNGLIGGVYSNAADIAMGKLTGNAFTDIEVALHGYRDTHYLAGGGVIGLRATEGSATMGDLVGNVFRNVSVKTDQDTNAFATGSAYIEGGGLIGVDAVSSPADRPGHASIQSLGNNLFSGIQVVSDDIILGGGLVGVNNNSQRHDAATYAELLAATGNVFGNGVLDTATPGNSSIYVHAGYSLRGGGIIGINGLSNAAARLDALERNVFAGIHVETGSYLKGGGIVGVQGNDGGDGKLTPGSMLPVSAWLGDVRENLFFNLHVGVGVEPSHGGGYLAGGGVVGARSNAGLVALNGLENNIFKDLSVHINAQGESGKGYLDGGGIVGVSAQQEAVILGARNNYFDDIAIQTTGADAGLRGGGVLGASSTNIASGGADPGKLGVAEIDEVIDNYFGRIAVQIGGNLSGGGIVGVNGAATTGAHDYYALIPTLTGNIFAGATVDATGSLMGGGLVGAHVDAVTSGTGSGAAGSVLLARNIFRDARVSAGNLAGGGFIGFDAAGDGSRAYLGEVSGNRFYGNGTAPDVQSDGYISGGGIIGLRVGRGLAALDELGGNLFSGLKVEAGGALLCNDGGIMNPGASLCGGGVVGASSGLSANMALVHNNVFEDITVTTADRLHGGGILGLSAYGNNSANAAFGEVRDNFFRALVVQAAGEIQGGGIVGARTAKGLAGAAAVSGNRFEDMTVAAASIIGGGVIGLDADILLSTFPCNPPCYSSGQARLEKMENNAFINPTVTTTGYIDGGGVTGVRSRNNRAYIDTIRDSLFQGATITAGSYISGGGLIGVMGNGSVALSPGEEIGIGGIDNSVFRNNAVTAQNGQIMGGAIYSYGLAGGMYIRDSQFIDNTFTSAISDASAYNGGSAPDARVYGTVAVNTGSQLAFGDAHTLTLFASAGKRTLFQNNTLFEDGATRANALYFGVFQNMTTNSSTGVISFTNGIAQADALLIVAPSTDGVAALYDPIRANQNNGKTFNMAVQGTGGDFLWGGANEFTQDGVIGEVNFFSGSRATLLSGMELEAVAHDVTLNPGGRINVMGKNKWRIHKADLNGGLHFNLMAAVKNDLSTTLLTIGEGVNSGSPYASIAGATVSLSNFAFGPALNPGDEFYLIAADAADDLADAPVNNTAYARQGMTRGYNFVIDKNPTQNNLDASGADKSRMLVARLVSAPLPARETRILTEGRVASLALLGQNANWLADHSYQQADLALRQGENRAFFGGADYAETRIDTGSTVDYRGYSLVAGEAIKREKADQSFLLGGFFEAGYGDYDIHGKFGHPDHPNMKGDGTLRYYGLGVMARQKWDKGLRLEGSLRGGRQENKFRSRDLTDVDGTTAKYTLHTPWFGAHLGAGYEWQANAQTAFDAYLRYYWTRQEGKSVHLNQHREKVRFLADESHRLRLGGRYTHIDDSRRAWYLGLAYEHEFNHRASARSMDGDIDTPDPSGDGFVGEIGMILHPENHKRLSAEFGLQGYTGKREGVSGGFRLGWKF